MLIELIWVVFFLDGFELVIIYKLYEGGCC